MCSVGGDWMGEEVKDTALLLNTHTSVGSGEWGREGKRERGEREISI